MGALQKKIVLVALVFVCLILGIILVGKGGLLSGGSDISPSVDAVSKEGQKAPVSAAYRETSADVVFWYEDASYQSFFETAAALYFEKTGIKVAVECRDTIDYLGDIYDATMRDQGFPDVYLLPGDSLEQAYLYGLVAENEKGVAGADVLPNAVAASTYEGKLLGYPLSFNTCVFIFQSDYFGDAPQSLQSIIDYSNQNDQQENVEFLMEWDVNDAFYDFPFISNSVTFEKAESGSTNVIYNEELYQQDLEYFEQILVSFSVDAEKVTEDRIVQNFKAGRTLSAIIDTDSLHKLEGYSYSLMKMPNLSDTLTASSCATTDLLVVNDFSPKGRAASDFAHFATVAMADRLYGMTGHFSVIPREEETWVDQVAYDAYGSAVLVPSSQDTRNFWVELEETISRYF